MRQKILTKLIAIRLDSKTDQELKRLATKEGKNKSEMIRILINNEVRNSLRENVNCDQIK